MYLSFTDETLMELLQKDDQLALETLFKRYYKILCQFCTVYTKDSSVAEEIIANLFIKLWESKTDVQILNVRSYLFTSAKNLSLNFIQKKKEPIYSIEDTSVEQHLMQDTNTPFKILSGRESCNNIFSLIDVLPPAQRQVLLMSRIDGIGKEEIAGILGISVRTVETTLYQSIKKLRLLLKHSANFNAGS